MGVGLVVVVAGAIAITTLQGLQNTQFSKNQVEATKKAQENIERVRTVKNSNFGVCTLAEGGSTATTCSTWEDIWSTSFGLPPNCTNGCTFIVDTTGCPVSLGTAPVCLEYSATRADLGNGFTAQITLNDEAPNQKRITSKVFWTDTTGEHSSNLVTILSRL